MSSPSFDRVGALWSESLQQAPIDPQRSLVRLLEAVTKPPVSIRKPTPTRYFLAAALALSGVGAVFVGYRQFAQGPSMASAVNVVPGAWLETRRDQKVPMRFSEGSEVVVSEASRVRVASVDPRGASVVVERGSLKANIVHRSDTNWAFAAGPFNVRVTGTTLRVGWRPEQKELNLSVDEGSVVAEGPLLGNGRVVRKGESCRVQLAQARVECSGSSKSEAAQGLASAAKDPEPAAQASAQEDVNRLPLVTQEEVNTEAAASKPPTHVFRHLDQMRELERAGKYSEALKAAEGQGFDRLLHSGTAEDLFCLARLGRYQKRPDLSYTALTRIRDRFGKTKEAAVAAFLLGRQSPPAEGARWFSTYLAEQPHGSLAREASGRLVESLHRAGQFSAAQAAARNYLAAYPAGPHAGFAKSLLANP
ncbi:MAG TPA: FecR domain-containing protein [Polyangiaceae bacterium]|nr:FecR domain-containing protein [Polyangiaceae bacterium]